MLTLLFIYSSAFIQYVQAVGHWSISLQYSASAVDDFISLGSITVDRTFDNNFTARFQSSVNPSKWQSDLLQAAKNGWTYRVKANSDKGDVQGYNEPCLMLQANGAHHFRVLLDPDRQNLQSLAVFPENLFSVGTNYHSCEANSFTEESKIKGSVVVNTINELPLPDAVSYIRKMEKERQARQHGAQQDNRSFIQKYWMYIVAALIFMIVSNATAAEQGGE
uniref:ER membrane protein complex subunit 10 n=1 Tax=Elaeophora elaphi TaxID=1147741 RepID=A0A0R3S1U7_9BILA